MIKKILPFILAFSSTTVFACPRALPTDNPGFCPSFKAAATCHCTSSGLPAKVCQDMRTLYNRMVSAFGSLQKACEYQHHTTTQDCIDNWNCYLNGGVDSTGKSCSSTNLPCS